LKYEDLKFFFEKIVKYITKIIKGVISVSMKDSFQKAMDWMKEFSKTNPEQMKSFQNMMEAIEKEEGAALDKKTKELIAVALSIARDCEWCIACHVKFALEAGATEEEILEAAWVAVLMGGGPALMHAGLVLEALKDLK
jgi:AhpD family alkylhydroperoxidase